MVKRYYRSVFDELEDIRKYMEMLNRQMYGTSPAALLPAAGEPLVKMLPVQRTTFPADTSEFEDEVVVTAEMIVGTRKKDIMVDLISPRALEITCERTDEITDENEGYYLRGRTFGSMTRIISLPAPVTDVGSSAKFRNGVLEVHLRKTGKKSRGNIFID